MTMTATLQPPPAPAAATDCDALLRQARQLLDAGQLAPASAAGWQAAQAAMAAYAATDGTAANANFTDAARHLVKHHHGDDRAAEWAVSSLALADNAQYDWLPRDGVARRLDDVQRLIILIHDLANPPSTAAKLLRQAYRCMDNGSLPVASEKGWQAALLATKTYADAVGCDYQGEYHFEKATRLLGEDESLNEEVRSGESAAAWLRGNISYCVYPKLYPAIVAEDLGEVVNLVKLIQDAVDSMQRKAG